MATGLFRHMPLLSFEATHHFGTEVELIAPPYRCAPSLDRTKMGEEVPLGSVMFGKGDMTLAVLADLTTLSHRWPWGTPCLRIPVTREPLEPLLMLVSELRDRLAVVKQPADAGRDQFADVVAAVRQRPVPSALGLASWVARRLRQQELHAPLCAQFREALQGIPASASTSLSTFSRIFSRYGLYTARDWRAVARLCVHVAAKARAAPPRLSLRTAWNYTHRYLAVPYRVVAERVGWEWVMEGALRVAGYVH